ncbi:unnamed protein product [Arctogadus glacialis]
MSSSTSSAAEVIPSVTVLKRLLARENEEDTDPRFKDRYFTGADSIKHAKDALTQEVEKMEALQSSRTTPEGAEAVPGNPHKAPRMEAQPDSSSSSSRKSSFKGLFEEILQEHGEERGASSTSTQDQEMIYCTYLVGGKPVNRFIQIVTLDHTHSQGILDAILKGLKVVGVQEEDC